MCRRKSVLIIDDDRDMAAMAAFRLESAGYRVHTCRDGHLGCELAVDQRVDVILLDLRIPPGDGLATLSRLQRHETSRQIPIVVFSVDRERRRQAVAMGAQYYLDKPYSSRMLQDTVLRAVTEMPRLDEQVANVPLPESRRPSGTFRRIDALVRPSLAIARRTMNQPLLPQVPRTVAVNSIPVEKSHD